MINKLIEQIGGERLEQYAFDKRMCNINEEIRLMARALLAVLDAQEKPVAWCQHGLSPAYTENKSEADYWASRGWGFTPLYTTPPPASVPDGWKLVPIEPTEDMVISGFESKPREGFSDPDDWGAFEAMSGCQQAAHKARLCYAAMLAAAPAPGGE